MKPKTKEATFSPIGPPTSLTGTYNEDVHRKSYKNDRVNTLSLSKSSALPNRTLVILMGDLRGGEQAWETLYKNVLDPNSANLALVIGKERKYAIYPNSTLFKRAIHTWTFPEYGDWADALDMINGTHWRKTHLPEFHRNKNMSFESGLYGGIKGFKGSGMIIFMIRWFLSQRVLENDIISKYDTFVLTRADHYYQCQHNFTELNLADNTMYVPTGEGWGGITDRHLVVSKENLLDSIDIVPMLLEMNFNQFLFTDNGKPLTPNPEKVLKMVWKAKGLHVKTFPRVMFTCATKFDTTRWQKAKENVPGVPGLMKKYVEEYKSTQKNCRKDSIEPI